MIIFSQGVCYKLIQGRLGFLFLLQSVLTSYIFFQEFASFPEGCQFSLNFQKINFCPLLYVCLLFCVRCFNSFIFISLFLLIQVLHVTILALYHGHFDVFSPLLFQGILQFHFTFLCRLEISEVLKFLGERSFHFLFVINFQLYGNVISQMGLREVK